MKRNIITEFLLCLFFGWLGVHKFYKSKIGLGIVYLLTFGLFGIGWLVDTVSMLMEVFKGPSNKNKHSKAHQSSSKKETSKVGFKTTSSSPPKATPNTISEAEKNYNLFLDCEDQYYLAYEYEENIALPEIHALTGNGGKRVDFVQEPENSYDNKAVAIYLNGAKVGYLYRGNVQSMVNDWIRRADYFWGYINKVDVINSKATVKLGFYKPLDALSVKSFRLTKITKREDDFGNSRYENIACCEDGDMVEFSPSFDSDNYIVTDESGNELGELNATASEWIDENEDAIKICRITDIQETDSGNYKATIEVYFN